MFCGHGQAASIRLRPSQPSTFALLWDTWFMAPELDQLGLLAMQGVDPEGQRIPIGDWFSEAARWCDVHLKGLFNVIRWPFDRALDLIIDAEGAALVISRVPVVVILGLLAYLSGGIRRAACVVGSLGVLALMGNTIWTNAVFTLYMLSIVLLAVSFVVFAGIALAAWRGHTGSRIGVLTGWSWVQPYALVVPGIWFFGIGSTASLILATLYAVPFAIDEALEREDLAPHRPGLDLLRRTQVGTRSAVQPALLAITIFSIIGVGGLPALLFRSLSNQDPVLSFDASLAIWLVGLAAWGLLGPWKFDHLPGRSNEHADPALHHTTEESTGDPLPAQ